MRDIPDNKICTLNGIKHTYMNFNIFWAFYVTLQYKMTYPRRMV